MIRLSLLLLSILLYNVLPAQDTSGNCFDLTKQNFDAVTAKDCGLVIEHIFYSRAEGFVCDPESEHLPFWGKENAELLSFQSDFNCDTTLAAMEKQRGQVRIRVSEIGAVESVEAMRFPSDALAQRIESHFIQMDNWTPGHCAGEPMPYNVDIIVTFAPQAD